MPCKEQLGHALDSHRHLHAKRTVTALCDPIVMDYIGARISSAETLPKSASMYRLRSPISGKVHAAAQTLDSTDRLTPFTNSESISTARVNRIWNLSGEVLLQIVDRITIAMGLYTSKEAEGDARYSILIPVDI